MRKRTWAGLLLLAGLLAGGTQVGTTQSPSGKVQPRLEPYAETKLLMEGLALSNFRGLERILSERQRDVESWTFARGQALLLAETGNLLMLRPPRNAGQAEWFQRATEFRSQAAQLAQVVAQKDVERSKQALHTLAGTCNRCHQTFRINVQLTPFVNQPGAKVKL